MNNEEFSRIIMELVVGEGSACTACNLCLAYHNNYYYL